MSIVERMLEKGRAADEHARSRRASDADAQRLADRAQLAAAIDPAVRILGSAVAVDIEQCRERRVLLRGSDEDAGAMAAYRMLRTRLLRRARTNGWTNIAVTSAGPNDGKTLTAINLAFSMARDKSREIVLLDMDMRNPSVCRTLGVDPRHDLRAYMDPRHDLHAYMEEGDRVRDLFFSVGSDNLMIAGSTTPTEDASELLGSHRFDDLLRAVRHGTVNTVVLIDLPPVLLTDDALVVAPKIDAVLVVAAEGLTGRSQLAKALDLLSEFPIAGVVLNRAVEATPGYDYGYYSNSEKGASEKKS